MPDWASEVLTGLTGPYGVIIALAVVVYFLWRLFREAQKEAKSAWEFAREASETTKELTIEVRAWREQITVARSRR